MVFQFHKGTIRTQFLTLSEAALCHFNSIKVQLELHTRSGKQTSSCNFNSIKVQLEQTDASDFVIPELFQFHKGTIRTPTSSYGADGKT